MHQPDQPVVVGIDGSASARRAAAFAAEEAVARDVPLCLVHVIPWPNPGAAATRYADRVWVAELRRSAEELLEDAVTSLPPVLPRSRTTTRVGFGDTGTELAHAASGAPVLVVGARGTGGLTGVIIGSTATTAAACAACPVVVLPADPASPDLDRRTVVVGVAGCGRDDDALTFAFAEAALRDAELVAVHAATASEDPSRDPQRVLAEALAGHRDKHPDVAVREVPAWDRAVPALVREGWSAQLLVVGRSHRQPLGRLASPTHGVLHRATCPVAVVPAPAAPSRRRP